MAVYEPFVILNPEKVHIHPTARVDSFVKLEGGKGLTLGAHVHIASFSHINIGGGKVIFEDHSGCASGCRVGSASPDWSYLYTSAAEPGQHRHTRYYTTIIYAYALLGMNVVVLPGRSVGEGAIVLPGSVVEEDVPAWTIVKGNPARFYKRRNITTTRLPTPGLVTVR